MKKLLLSGLTMLLTVSTYSQSLFPYLQSPTPTSIFITWKTNTNTTPSVQFGTSASSLTSTTTGSASQFTDAGYSGNYFYNTVQLINLIPNTKYYYKIVSGAQSSVVNSFKTLPNPGEASTVDGHIRFLIMGDNQLIAPRYDSIVSAAKRKVFEKWGGDASDNVSLTFMVGDQVDLGNLTQYENIHFAKNKALSGSVPIQTTVGNHETYGALGMSAYYSHFYLNGLSYQGISSGTENYYAIQAGNTLFISLSSEHTGTDQFTWLQSVMTATESDSTVDWVFTFSHRPYESEQYVGDISTWIKNTAVPYCMNFEKYMMHVGAHHHIYSRGQFKDKPVYNIISGGSAWDQYWGMATEQDFDYIQKTLSNWLYQIVDVDVTNGKIDVESYSIGSIYQWKNNQLMDEFHRYKNQPEPNQPTITTNFGDSLQLPFLIQSSAFSTSTAELLNTTEFQIAQTSDFSVLERDDLRDFENLFGQVPGENPDTTIDLNLNVDILQLNLPVASLQNGTHYVRVRHRDRNLEWSDWSPAKSFVVYNSFTTGPYVAVDSNEYHLGSPIIANYANGPGNSTDWVGTYKVGQTPGGTPSTVWDYVSGVSGTMTFAGSAITQSDLYFAGFFENDGYSEIATRDTFYYGKIPVITSDTNAYALGSTVPLYVSQAPAVADSIEVLKVGFSHGVNPSAFWQAVNQQNDTLFATGLPLGYYSTKYYFKGEQVIGEPFFFQVGDTITGLWTDQSVYELGDDIIATWTDAPGIVKDWLGIYQAGANPNIDPLLSYNYFDGQAFGTKVLSDTMVPSNAGDYFIVMFTNDSYTEVSNRVNFTIIDPSLGMNEKLADGISICPNPTENLSIIKSDYPIVEISLLDATGKVIYKTENVNNQQFSLLTQDLPVGIYTVQIQSRKLFTYKLVVSK